MSNAISLYQNRLFCLIFLPCPVKFEAYLTGVESAPIQLGRRNLVCFCSPLPPLSSCFGRPSSDYPFCTGHAIAQATVDSEFRI